MKHFSYISSKVKEQDLFGHQVSFNFNEKGDTHNTLIGGICSLIIKIGMLAYITVNVIKLVTFNGDEVGMSVKKLSLREAGVLEYGNKPQLFFWAMSNTNGGYKSLFLNDPHL